jgi:hypothetical protein
MTAKNISGSIRKLALSGIAFNVAADSNVSMPGSGWENSNVPTSGPNMRKMTKRSIDADGLVVIANADDLAALKTLAEQLDPFTMSVTNAAGDTLRNTGTINIDTHESEENRVTIKLLPETNDWTTSVGEVSV